MKINEILTEAVKQRLDAKCWKNKHKEGTKIKGGVRVNNCVPNESLNEFSPGGSGNGGNYLKALASAWYNDTFNTGDLNKGIKSQEDVERILERGIHCGDGKIRKYMIGYNHRFDGVDIQSDDHYEYSDYDDAGRDIDSRTGKPWGPYDVIAFAGNELDESIEEDWQKTNRRDKTNGMSSKAVKAYRRENPGSKLKTAVTTKPSKLKPGSKAAKRRKSFCARMSGNKGPMKKPNGKPTPKALALRRWNCESVEEMVDMILENMDHDKDNQAVPELKAALLAKKTQLKDATDEEVYDIIDSIMTRIAKSHGISGQKLHDMWVAEYDQIPDTWIMK